MGRCADDALVRVAEDAQPQKLADLKKSDEVHVRTTAEKASEELEAFLIEKITNNPMVRVQAMRVLLMSATQADNFSAVSCVLDPLASSARLLTYTMAQSILT